MKRDVSLEEIWDGRFYGAGDMAKLGCGDCEGCHSCCQDMGDTIQLDPLDVFRLTEGLGRGFDELLGRQLRLGAVDGIVLPHLSMGDAGKCLFLNKNGRCDVHSIRPGICRLFPLGRFYENGGFRYFLQKNECVKKSRTKVKIEKWVDTPKLAEYERYITKWHYHVQKVQEIMHKMNDDERRLLNTYLLQLFYRMPYRGQRDFYEQFEERMDRMNREVLG